MLESEYLEKKGEFYEFLEKLMAGKSHLSFSSFKNFIDGGPRLFFEKKMFKTHSDAMDEGKAFHMCVLEPVKYDSHYIIFDDSEIVDHILKNGYEDSKGKRKQTESPRSVGPYKKWKANWEKDNAGKEKITKEKDLLFRSMSDYLARNSLSKYYLEQMEDVEVDMETFIHGIKFIGKIDMVAPNYTLDLKKIVTATPKKIYWTSRDMLYDYQGGLYAKMGGKTKHVILAMDESHRIQVLEVLEEHLEHVTERLEWYVSKFIECIENDLWHESVNFFNNNEPEIMK